MEEKKLSQQESLQIIQQMINTAKHEQKDDGVGWIIWGWLLFLASIFTWLNIQYHWFKDVAMFWNALGICVVLYWVYRIVTYATGRSREKVKTYTADLFAKLNSGFFIFLLLIIFSMNIQVRGVPPAKGFMLLTGLYGFWILVYGTALDFKPSIIAAYITWAIAFAGLFIYKIDSTERGEFQLVMLVHALAVLIGYIIPGHLANKEFKKLHRKDKYSV
ncbi:MAG TPA: hypothetical protein VGQ09_21875 [Chitinophagaceae bacterium]|jgi:hypothetical protein|nr:hypothetical protein [Chitinophagaceae bacterium]